MTGPDPIGVRALAVAKQYVGTVEAPSGSNRTMFGQWFGVDGEPWCAIFASYCFERGASVILCDGFDGPGVRAGKGCAWVPTIVAWAKARGFWLPASETPVSGDLAIYDWQGDGKSDHVGIVESALAAGDLAAIEGNVASAVVRATRHRRELAGLVRITG